MSPVNARKRPGHPLLPTCGPKQPRLVLVGHDGNAPSPSQPTLMDRWYDFAFTFGALVRDTIAPSEPRFHGLQPLNTLTKIQGSDVRPMDPPNDSSDSSNDLPCSHSSPRTHTTQLSQSSSTSAAYETSCRRSSGSSSGRSTANKAYVRPEEIPLPPSPQKPTFKRASSPPRSQNKFADPLSNHMSSQSTPGRDSGSSTPVISPDSPPHSSLAGQENITPSLQNLHLDDSSTRQEDWGSVTSSSFLSNSTIVSASHTPRRTAQSLKSNPSKRKVKRRDHIHMKPHKAKLKREKEQLRERLTSEIFQAKRKLGFSSTYSDLKSLLDFRSQLEKLDSENTAGVPHAVGTLSVKSTLSNRTLLDHDDDSDDRNSFLQRVLLNVQATVNSPAPPKPFIPTLEQLKARERIKDDAIERRLRPPPKALPTSLPAADEQLVNTVLSSQGFTAKYAREQVNHSDITRLLPRQWLNDELINFYGAMILGRSETAASQSGKKILNIHYFNSFFWTKLIKEGYEKGRLAKWTKKIDIFSKDAILLPVNHNNTHWTAASINFRSKRFESYDSMGMAKEVVFKVLRLYVSLEHKNKRNKDFDFTGWTNWAPEETPQQENGYDCGVFSCQFMEALSRGEETFNFSQKDMPYLRRRMIWEIGKAKLRDDR